MYLIIFDKNKQANCITPTSIQSKDEIYLFDKLPDFEPRPGYANSLHLNDDNELEWHWTELPHVDPPTEEEREEMASFTEEYQMGYDRAVLDMMEVEE